MLKDSLFVSPDGDDKNDGLSKTVSAEGNAGPLATLDGAMRRIRLLRDTGQLAGALTVWIRGGVYRMKKTLVIRPEDSGPVCFKAVPGETPVFRGGAQITGWRKTKINGAAAWRAAVPGEGLKFGPADQFFVNGGRKKRARLPKKGFYKSAAPSTEVKNELFDGSDCVCMESKDFNPDLHDIGGIEAVLTHKWIEERMPLESADKAGNFYRSSRCSRFEMNPADTDIRLENVREALTEPGEYYFDRAAGEIIYIPEPGENPESMDAFVPALGCALRFDGDPESGSFVEWLSFEDLTFEGFGAGQPDYGLSYDFKDETAPEVRNHSIKDSWLAGGTGKLFAGSPQGASHLPGVIFMRGAKNCSVKNCSVAHGGWYAVNVSDGCERIRIERGNFHDLGGGGVKICGADPETAQKSPALASSRIIVEDCHIHGCGRIHLSAIGIIVQHALGCLLEHNHIHDLFYSGISCGWIWGYGDSVSRENRIGWNKIHDIGKGVLSDMGGIYLLGIQPGTRVYNNHVFNVTCKHYGGWGIYTDEGSAHIVIEENICHDCSKEGFHQHYGRENTVRYNILAYPGENAVALSRGTVVKTGYVFPGENYSCNLVFYGNIMLVDGKPFFKSHTDFDSISAAELYSESNCFCDLSGKNICAALVTVKDKNHRIRLGEWQKSYRHDMMSLFADPLFVCPEKRDFRLKPDSPLLKGPFRNIDLSSAGVRPAGDAKSGG